MKRFILTLFCVFSASMAMATTYNVSKSGSNANSCATAQSGGASAKLTIAAGVSCLSAGDTLVIAAGTYTEAIQNAIPSGSSANARTVIKRNGSDTVILKPSGDQAGGAIIGHWMVSYVEIDGLELDGTNATNTNGLDVDDEVSTGWYIHDLYIHDADFHGLIIDGGSHTLANIRIVHVGFTTTADLGNGTNPGGGHCFYLHFHDSSITNSSAENCGQYGFHQYGTIGGRSNNILTGLVAKNTGRSGVIIGSGSGNRLSHSIIYSNSNGNSFGGILSNGSNGRIYNNTIYNNAGSCIYQIFGTGNVFANNLCSANGTNSITEDSTSGNTLTTNLTGTQLATNHFVNAAGGNFSLISTSAAINAGTAAIATGITACANGNAPDVGAIESLGTIGATVNGTAATVTVENNCTSGMLPATGVTGWTFKTNGSGNTVTTNVLAGSNSYGPTLTSAFVGGDTCLFSYSQTGNSVSNNNIGNVSTSNQEVFAFTDAACTNITGGGGGSVGITDSKVFLIQGSTPSAWVPKCTLNASNCTVAPGSKLFIVWTLGNSSGTAFPMFNYATYTKLNSGSIFRLAKTDGYGLKDLGNGAQLGTVVSETTPLPANFIADRQATDVAGMVLRSNVAVPSLNLPDSSETQIAQGVQVAADAVPGDVITVYAYKDDGTALSGSPITITVGGYSSVR